MSEMGWYKDLDMKFDAVVPHVKEALQKEGFGVLSEIAVDEKFKGKLGVEFPRYLILGACNPALAHTVLSATRDVGLLLPCNVTLEETATGTRVGIVKPKQLVGFWAGDAEIAKVADDASERLQRVIESI